MNVQENKLEELLAGDDLGAVEAYLASFSDLDRDSLRIHYLAVVRKTKNYAALPLLRASLPSIHSRKLYPLLADAVREGTIPLLQKFLSQRLKPACVSRACGFEEVDFELIPKSFADIWTYIEGAIESDNLELFLKYRSLYEGDVPCILSYASECCSRRIITHHGFSATNIALCVLHSFRSCNKDTLLFLRSKCDKVSDDQFENAFLWLLTSRPDSVIDHSFLVDCFNSKLITLTQEGWQKFKAVNSNLYDKVQDDV